MVHRAVLAGGAMLQSHEALLSLLHKDLFAAMVVAVSAWVCRSRANSSSVGSRLLYLQRQGSQQQQQPTAAYAVGLLCLLCHSVASESAGARMPGQQRLRSPLANRVLV
jgi:phage gp46-like protein